MWEDEDGEGRKDGQRRGFGLGLVRRAVCCLRGRRSESEALANGAGRGARWWEERGRLVDNQARGHLTEAGRCAQRSTPSRRKHWS